MTNLFQAHYGVRSKRYKLIFWYNQGYDLEGTRKGGEEQEWELFDVQEDPLELINVWSDPKHMEAREKMLRRLEKKMEEIGDLPAHTPFLSAVQLSELYRGKSTAAVAKSSQQNL